MKTKTKLHNWPTRRDPKTGRYQVLIDGQWMTRQRAWQLRMTAEGRCRACGLPKRRAGVFCGHCAEKHVQHAANWYAKKRAAAQTPNGRMQ